MQIVNDESIQCIFLQETWLDASIQSFQLPNFVCLARKDRADGPNRGGVAIFVRSDIANVTFLQHGSAGETSWLLLHRDTGTIALCNCYFPPTCLPKDFHLFSNDIDKMHDKADYVFISGDFNVHSKSWLHFSSGDNALRFQEVRANMHAQHAPSSDSSDFGGETI